METEIKIFGIRHHGAGSAKRLYSALNKFKPDEICIEMPFESRELITQLKVTPHVCPLAFLFYNKENSKQSMYYPFAEFSPEYQAIKYSFEQNIPIIPIDLPAGMSLIPSNFKKETEVGLNSDQQHMVNDPLGYLARQSGYKDTERWWDTYFESWTEDEDLFNIIHNLMLELRTISKGIDDSETLIREEFMRQQIKFCLNKTPEKLAIICGAWHSPALIANPILHSTKVNVDSLKNLSIGSSIIPWTYSRLALNKYYSAGIESPVWHECIFQNSETAISNWLSQAATQFRINGFQVSTAELIDTERLSKELAMLREMPIAGIEELMDACTTVIGKGDVHRINLLKNQMIIGNKSGEIEVNSETLSLIKEFKTKLNLLRLTKHWSESGSDFLELDLRKEKHLAISRFLHQSILLKLYWCQPQELEIKAQGNFHENWKFEWNPDQEMTLIQAAIHASTIEDAIYYYVLDQLEQSNDFISLAHTLEHGLKANLDKLWPMISDKINLLSIKSNEVESLCALIRPIISTISYGNLYQMDTKILEKIINQIIPKIILEFGTQCSFIKSDKAKRMLKCLDLISTFFLHTENIEYLQLWKDELINNSNLESIHPLVRGKIWYKILEDKYLSEDEFITELEYQFLNISDAQKTAYWIEGFMYQSTSFYLMQDFSLTLINHWISELEEIKFKEVLPLLRRSFSELNTTEILRIKTKLRQQSNSNQQSPIHLFLDPDRTKKIETMLSNLQ